MSSTSTPPETTLSTTRPFGGKKKLYNIATVQFRLGPTKHDADARELQLHVGQQVIVDTARGPVIAIVTAAIHRKVVPVDSLPKILRKATETDAQQAERNEEVERDAYRFGIERIRSRKLPMKLIRAQFMQDGSKIVFYFSAEGRIDFRDLVKDLAHRFRARIEMHQIGVRDGARMLGGIGPCGRELCCSTFLDNFDPVSIRMAKDQGLTLNPKKVSGMCGRLMCCLVYEQQVYRRMRTRLPRAGQRVNTEAGPAEILDVDVINRRVTVRLDDNNRRSMPVDEVAVIDPHAIVDTVDSDASPNTDYLWDDALPETRSTSRRRPSPIPTTEDPEISRRRTSGRRRRRESAVETAAVSRTRTEEVTPKAPSPSTTPSAQTTAVPATAPTATAPPATAPPATAPPATGPPATAAAPIVTTPTPKAATAQSTELSRPAAAESSNDAAAQTTKSRRRRSRRGKKPGTPTDSAATPGKTPGADKKPARARRRKPTDAKKSDPKKDAPKE